MALTTYATLKTALADWLHRGDITSSSDVVDDAIDMCESWINRNLRIRQMEGEATATVAEYLSLPTADFLQMRDVEIQSSPRINLRYVTPEYADLYDSSGEAAEPKYYTIVGNQIRIVPEPSSSDTIRMSYWKKVTALSGSNATNELFPLYADLYLYGCLMHLRAYIQDDGRAQAIASAFSQIVTEIQRMDRRSNYGGSLQIRPA